MPFAMQTEMSDRLKRTEGVNCQAEGLPEDKRRRIVIYGDVLLGAAGRLIIFFDLGAAAPGQQARQGEIDESIKQSHGLQHQIKQAHAEGDLNKGRLSGGPQTK
jgi:hypothetical protein